MSLKVVVDTNVFISSFWGGKPRDIIDLWSRGNIVLCISDEILREYLEVMTRLNLSQDRIEQFILLFGEKHFIEDTNPIQHFTIIKDDPDDNKFIDCAVAGDADYVISGDKHLLTLKSFKDFTILTPAEFLIIYDRCRAE
jgi:putative PIN family toxin of toxin-antitoxin system